MHSKTRKSDFLIVLMIFSFSLIQATSMVDSLPVYYYPHYTYNAKDGLSQSYTYSIFEDSKGYIWVGTREGINKFDGLVFENFHTNPDFPDGHFTKIFQDHNKNVFFKNTNSIYQYENDTFKKVKFWEDTRALKEIRGEHFDKNGTFWFLDSEKNQIFSIPSDSTKSEKLKIESQEINGLTLNTFFHDADNNIVLFYGTASQNSILLLKDQSGAEKSFPIQCDYCRLKQFEEDIFLMKNDSIFKIEKNSMNFSFKIPKQQVDFEITKNDTLIISRKRNMVYRKQNDRWENLGIEFGKILNILTDSNQIIWLATDKGLVKVLNTAFKIFPTSRGALKNIWNIIEDNQGEFWMSSYGHGLQKLNSDWRYENNYNHLQKEFYIGATRLKNGDIFFPTADGVIRLDENNKLEKIKPLTQQGRAIQDIAELNGKIYMASSSLVVMDSLENIQEFKSTAGLDMSRLKYFETLEFDKFDNLWLGSHHGLTKFDGINFSTQYVPDDIPYGVNHMYKDYKQNLWVGSHHGLLFMRDSSLAPQPILEDIVHTSVKFISAIDTSFLVFGLLDQLIFLDLDSFYAGNIKHYILDVENGFDGTDCIQGSGRQDSQGKFWLATRTNVIQIDPDKLNFDNTAPNVKFRSIESRVKDKTKSTAQSIHKDYIENIELTSDHTFQINFFAVNHSNPKKVNFQYLLINYDADWSILSNNRFANYSNLEAGKYMLLVRSELNGSYSMPEMITIEIKAIKWFSDPKRRLLLGILVLSLVLGAFIFGAYHFIRRILASAQSQSKILEKENSELRVRQKLLSNQANPHFVFNILNHITWMVDHSENRKVKKFIAQFATLFRPMLKDDEKLTWKLEKELEFVKYYLALEKIRFPKKFNYDIQIDSEVDQDSFVPKMIIQSFVNNSIKYAIEPLKSKGDFIKVVVSKSGDYINILVEDNGEGFDDKKKSIKAKQNGGINTIRETLKLLNSNNPAGKSTLRLITVRNKQKEPISAKTEITLFAKYKFE